MSAKNKSTHIPKERLQATLGLDEPIDHLKGISTARMKDFQRLKVKSIRDLLYHFPRRYVDLSQVSTAAGAQIGQTCTISGTIEGIEIKKPRRNLTIMEMAVADDSGVIMVTIFNKPWLQNKYHLKDEIAIAGKVEFNYGYKRISNPFIEPLGSEEVCGRIIAVYPATEKLSNTLIRTSVDHALKATLGLYDPLPLSLRARHRLMAKGSALSCIHRPQEISETEAARRRLVYEEFLMLELFLLHQQEMRCAGKTPHVHVIDGPCVQALFSSLPFDLTDDQRVAVDELLGVLAKDKVANHLILGDVGSGKTIVAAFGIASAKDSADQAMLLAPTEVLATQHFQTLGPLLAAAGITAALLTGSTPAHERAELLKGFKAGDIDVLMGTHALLEDDVVPHAMTLAIIDEQQRFGVDQRSKLLAKGDCPDALYLTATPIPRSLALAMFGNLTLSYIHQKPFSGSKRTTKVIHKRSMDKAYDAAREALAKGHQVYVVCPLIGLDSAARDSIAHVGEGMDEDDEHPRVSIEDLARFSNENVAAASTEAKFLQEQVFPDARVALLHGSLPAAEKARVMDEFKQGDVDILVTTTVIEVGVDVPNATVMIIEDADRFGLSQLHQLRGRVGRGAFDAEVFLVSASKNEAALKRLGALECCDDGFTLAEYDLSLRREGDILGNRQSGASVLRIADILHDAELLELAHADALALIQDDPKLASPQMAALAREIRILFSDIDEVAGG